MPVSTDRVLRLLDRRERPVLPLSALARALHVGRGGTRALGALLRTLERDGCIERVRGGFRIRRDQGALAEAVVERAPDGALVARDREGRAWTLGGGGADPGERVLVELLETPTGLCGEVVRRVGGARREWIGILERAGREGRLVPYRDDLAWELRVARMHWDGARVGDVVVALPAPGARRDRATSAHRRRRRPAGPVPPAARVVEVLGPPGTPEADFRAIAWRHRLPQAFPPAAQAEAAALPADLDPADVMRRVDLRALPFVTIDPATARDHDDAVCVEPDGRGFRLRVAIADVSAFVVEDGAIDVEARRRGNSVYFPDRAIPMLPERLSGELCSLRPDADRLAIAVELAVDARGGVRGARFCEAVIRSRARLVYDDAAEVMEGRTSPRVPEGGVTEQLRRLADLAPRLWKRRWADGAIDFDLPTAEIVLGDAGHPTDIIEAPRTIAHRAVEEAMLVANRAVAQRLRGADVPTLYRVHEPPTPTALSELRALLQSFGLLDLPRTAPLGAGEIAAAIQRAVGRPEERLVHTTTLRSMRPARYDPRCLGHFALAFDAYLHFTSPIRRYADLVAHRALRDLLVGTRESLDRAAARAPRMAAWAERTSLCERTAMDAEREAIDVKKCVFLRPRVGERFDATVTRVARHGFYATLDPFFVDGLVPLRTLGRRFELDDRGVALVSRTTGERFGLGDRVRVAVSQVDVVRGWIDFALLERLEPGRPRAQIGTGR
jgi:ribonuclease R